MKINYFLSDTSAAATSKAIQEVTKKAENNPFESYIVLVPETKSIAIEREILSQTKRKATANIFVYSFVRLLSRVGKIEPEKILNKQICVMLLRKIIAENESKFVCYKKTARNVNFAEKIYDTIQQFKSSKVSPDDLALGLSTFSSALKAKLTDIVLIYKEYEKMLGSELFDDTDKLEQLKVFAKNSEVIRDSEIFVVGFDNITWQMQDVLRELCTKAKEVTFSCVYFAENRPDKFIQNNDLYKKYKRIAEELKYPYVPVFAKSYYSGDFSAIKNYLFAPKKEKTKSAGQVEIFEAKNKYSEIEFIASLIIGGARQGARYRDFAIISENLAEDKEIFKKTFEKMGIPLFVSGEYDISSHPLTKFIVLEFELVSSHLSADKVLEFLSNQFILPDGIFDFENYVNEYGTDYNLFLKEPELSRLDEEKAKKIGDIFKFIQITYVENKKSLDAASTVADYIAFVKKVIEEANVEQKLLELSKFEDDNDLAEEAEISRVILGKLDEFMLSLENFLGEMKVSQTEFLQILLSGFGALKINLTPLSTDCVILQSNADGLFNIKTLFISSTEEGNFPAKINDSGIILDSELEEAKLVSGKSIEPTVSEINKRETFSAYETMLLPKEKLVLSYASKSLSGQANVASSLASKLVSLFGDEIVKKSFVQEKFVSKKDAEKRFAKNINRFLNNEYLLTDLNKEYSMLFDSFSKDFKKAILETQIDESVEDIDNADELYFRDNRTSVSQLEKYFACPYKFFATYGLRLKENKQAKMNSIDIGNFIHRVAELFTKKMRNFEDFSDEKLTEEIKKIIAQTESKLEIKQNKNQAVLGFLRKEVQRLCRYILKEQSYSSFKNNPQKNEFSFSGENAVNIELDSGRKIKIEGKIDRIDEYSDYVRIIDYKTGDISSDLTSIYYGKKIQLISYLLASEKISGKKVAGLFYFPIHSDFVKNDKNIDEKYKMQGFLLDNIEVVKHMDSSLSFDNPASNFVPIKIKTSKELENTNTFELSKFGQKKFLSEEEFNQIERYNKQECKTAMQEILSGYIEPSPLSIKSEDGTAECETCELFGFCGIQKSKFSMGRKCTGKVEIESFLKEEDDGSKLD